jgi:CheY-like chemotaxis protein
MRSLILVVDANPIFATLVRQTLEETGRYQVIPASKGQEALDLAGREDIRLAIIDLDLPDIPGIDVIRRIRSLRDDLVIVAVPVGGELAEAERQRLRIHDVLTKPFYLPELSHRIDAALGLAPAHADAVAEAASLQPRSMADELAAVIEAGLPAEPVTGPLALPEKPIPPPEHPSWLNDSTSARTLLASLLPHTSAEAILLGRANGLWGHAGDLSESQALALMSQVAEFWAAKGAHGAVARFVRLSGMEGDHMLYAKAVTGEIILALLLPPETVFSTIRRQAQRVESELIRAQPGATADADPYAQTGLDLQPPSPVGDLRPPSDWIPESLLTEADADVLAGLDLPPPDPGERTSLPTSGLERPEELIPLPSDWIPAAPRPSAHLPFLAEQTATPPGGSELEEPPPESSSGLEEPNGPLPEARYNLDFTAVLVPRFPNHRLTGRLAEDLRDWVARLCIAWGWRADEIDIQPDYLRLTVTLTPEVAPSRAVHRLRQDLSERILQAYPGVTTDLPSNRFWARGYLLSAGKHADPDRIRAFIAETRRTQGLPA